MSPGGGDSRRRTVSASQLVKMAADYEAQIKGLQDQLAAEVANSNDAATTCKALQKQCNVLEEQVAKIKTKATAKIQQLKTAKSALAVEVANLKEAQTRPEGSALQVPGRTAAGPRSTDATPEKKTRFADKFSGSVDSLNFVGRVRTTVIASEGRGSASFWGGLPTLRSPPPLTHSFLPPSRCHCWLVGDVFGVQFVL